MNEVMLSGRAVTRPEMKESRKSGRLFCVFRMAAVGEYRGKDAEREVDFFDVMCFGNQANAIHRHLKKGARLIIRGSLKNIKHEDRFGNRYVDNTIMMRRYEIIDWNKVEDDPIEDLTDSRGEPIIPREITESLVKQVDATDVDVPDAFIDSMSERGSNDLL